MFLLLEKFRNLGELPRILILANEVREHFLPFAINITLNLSIIFMDFNIWGYIKRNKESDLCIAINVCMTLFFDVFNLKYE